MSEKSQDTLTSKNPFEKSSSHRTEYFGSVVKDKRTGKNGTEFLIGWRDFPLDKGDTWDDYAAHPATVLKELTNKRKVVNETNASTALDNRADDIQEARDDHPPSHLLLQHRHRC